jgi:hypothetical protein
MWSRNELYIMYIEINNKNNNFGCDTRGTLMMRGYDSTREGAKGGGFYSWVLIQTHIPEFHYHC